MIFVPRTFSISRARHARRPPSPFGYVRGPERERRKVRIIEGSRVAVCRVYGNLTGVWFSKRAEDFAPAGETFVRYACTGVRARYRVGREGWGYDCDGDIKTQYPTGRGYVATYEEGGRGNSGW